MSTTTDETVENKSVIITILWLAGFSPLIAPWFIVPIGVGSILIALAGIGASVSLSSLVLGQRNNNRKLLAAGMAAHALSFILFLCLFIEVTVDLQQLCAIGWIGFSCTVKAFFSWMLYLWIMPFVTVAASIPLTVNLLDKYALLTKRKRRK